MNASILVVDPDRYTGPLLADELRARGHDPVVLVESMLTLPEALKQTAWQGEPPDVAVVNFHIEHPEVLAACTTLRLLAPGLPVVVLSAPGPALREARRWAEASGSVEFISQKPLTETGFHAMLRSVAEQRSQSRRLRRREAGLARFVPEAVRESAARGEFAADEAELIEAAVLFTDVRDSTRAISRVAPHEYFREINGLLSRQAQEIRAGGGNVVKFLGDGLLSMFRGPGRAHLALRCGLRLLKQDALAATARPDALRIGIGVAEGLVLAGPLGEGEHLHYDIIGATVHLAARLCARAAEGRLVAPRPVWKAARIETVDHQDLGRVEVRGFAQPVDCVQLGPAADIPHPSPGSQA